MENISQNYCLHNEIKIGQANNSVINQDLCLECSPGE